MLILIIAGLFTDSHQGILVRDTIDSYEDSSFVFTVLVKKGSRTAQARLDVDLTRGVPPSLKLK